MAVNREDIIINVEGARQAERELDDVGDSFDGLGASIGKASVKLGAAAIAIGGVAKAVFEAGKSGAQLEDLTNAFLQYGGTAQSLDRLSASLGETVSDRRILQFSNMARTLGINADQFEHLTKISKAAAATLGIDVTYALESVTTGVARQSKLWLDNLGIIVDVEGGNKKLAASLNKTVAQLTDAEKRQAFFNEVVEAGNRLMANAPAQSYTDAYGRIAASIDNATDSLNRWVALQLRAIELQSVAAAEAERRAVRQGFGQQDVERTRAIARYDDQIKGLTKSLKELEAQARSGVGVVGGSILQGGGRLVDAAEAREQADALKQQIEAIKTARSLIAADIDVGPRALPDQLRAAEKAALGEDKTKAARKAAAGKREEPFDMGRALQARAREQAAAGIALQEEALRAEAQLEQERMRLVAEGVEARIKARRQERADFLAGQQAQLDASLEVISAINAQAGAYARLGVSIDETGQQVVNSSAIMKAVGVDALASIGSALGDAAVAALFYGESFSKALGDALVQAGASAIGFAISGAAIAGVLAFISPAQAAAVGAASLAAGVAGTALVAIGKGMGGDINTGGVESMAPGGSGGAIGRGSPSEMAERDLMRDRRRSRNMDEPREVTIIINNSLGGERVDRAIHRAATRGARFDRPRRAGAM